MDVKNLIAIFLGGGVGSLLRFVIGWVFLRGGVVFPWGTLVANVLAAALIAWLYAMDIKAQSPWWWALLAIGVCGGLSTFSTFSLETFQLIQSGRWTYAILNVALSVVCSIGIIFLLARKA